MKGKSTPGAEGGGTRWVPDPIYTSGVNVASWNVNSLRMRLPILLAWLRAAGPDVVCLQETKVHDDEFPAFELMVAGYETAFWGEPNYNGVAILSRLPIEDVRRGLPGDADD